MKKLILKNEELKKIFDQNWGNNKMKNTRSKKTRKGRTKRQDEHYFETQIKQQTIHIKLPTQSAGHSQVYT